MVEFGDLFRFSFLSGIRPLRHTGDHRREVFHAPTNGAAVITLPSLILSFPYRSVKPSSRLCSTRLGNGSLVDLSSGNPDRSGSLYLVRTVRTTTPKDTILMGKADAAVRVNKAMKV